MCARDQVLDDLVAHVAHRVGDVLGLHQLAALLVDHLALVVHDVVELQQLLADLEVVGLDLLLRLLQRLVDPGVDDRLAFLEAQGAAASPSMRSEPKRRIRSSSRLRKNFERPGIALAAGAAAQLVVDPAALVPLGADDEQAAGARAPAAARPRPRPGSAVAPSAPSRSSGGSSCAIRMSALPPSWMSVPRPAMLVAMVTAPTGRPAR